MLPTPHRLYLPGYGVTINAAARIIIRFGRHLEAPNEAPR